jgi:hypothetical protein
MAEPYAKRRDKSGTLQLSEVYHAALEGDQFKTSGSQVLSITRVEPGVRGITLMQQRKLGWQRRRSY